VFAVQEIVLLQQQVAAHMDAFGEVKWELMAAEQFGGRRHHHKLRTVHIMLTRAQVRERDCDDVDGVVCARRSVLCCVVAAQ
jgi:hypothetical protein